MSPTQDAFEEFREKMNPLIFDSENPTFPHLRRAAARLAEIRSRE